MNVSMIMPVYNEEHRVEEAVRRCLVQSFAHQLIVVDDGSKDQTQKILERIASTDSRIIFLKHAKNSGKGAAIRTAWSHVSGDILAIQDADLEYDPADYARMFKLIIDGHADVVFGSRFLGSEAHRVLYFWHSIANRALTTLSNMLSNINLSDMETGMKAFRWSVVKDIRIRENRFGFEPEITAKVARKKLRIYEVAVSYRGRTYAEGKKINWTDGLAALWFILKYNLAN
ncbi:MAG: glycosyltransferase family 2 protein [Verrucomicrobiota bacterium]